MAKAIFAQRYVKILDSLHKNGHCKFVAACKSAT